MPLNLHDFLAQFNVTEEQIEPMITALYAKPPSVTDSISSEYYSPRLTEITSDAASKALASQQNIIIERETVVFTTQARLDEHKYAQVFGDLPSSEKTHMENLAILKATRFDIFKTGNCAVRASYAAFELYKLLGERASIGIQSCPERDQYTLMIRKKEKDAPWRVYDAITNPELLFDLKEYQSKILPLYPHVSCPARKYTLTLNAELYKKYQSILPRVKGFFDERAREINLDSLMSDSDFLASSGIMQHQSGVFTNAGMFADSLEGLHKKLELLDQAILAFKQDLMESPDITLHRK